MKQLKQAKDYDKAIALCRQAMEVLPTSPTAYLEGGRLLIKKKLYPPALQMFRDAKQVAVALPAPNEEIGNLSLTQIKEHIADCKGRGVEPDDALVAECLAEAVANTAGPWRRPAPSSWCALRTRTPSAPRCSAASPTTSWPWPWISWWTSAAPSWLRQRGQSDEAIAVYQKLLELRPGFTGVVLYNLAVAFQTKARQVLEKSPDKAEQLEIEASGTIVQAPYVDPSLPQEENFYRNTVMEPLLRHLLGCFQQAAQDNQEASAASARPCSFSSS